MCSCCSTQNDEEAEAVTLLEERDERSAEARRLAADAALRRAGSMLRPKRGNHQTASSSLRPGIHGDGMRWDAG